MVQDSIQRLEENLITVLAAELMCHQRIRLAQEDDTLEKNEEEYTVSEEAIKLRLKAYLARNLWNTNEFYQIYNASNEILNRAIEIIQNNEYDKVNLDR